VERGRHNTAVSDLSVMHWLNSADSEVSANRDLHVLLSIQTLLVQYEFFVQLDDEALQVVCENVWMVETGVDEIIVKQGDECDYFYCVHHGKYSCVDRQGRVIAELGPGDTFGELAILSGEHGLRNATVISKQEGGKLFRLAKAEFKMCLSKTGNHIKWSPELGIKILRKEPSARSWREIDFLCRFLQAISFFQQIGIKQRKLMAQYMVFESHDKGDIINCDKQLNIIVKGRVMLKRTGGLHDAASPLSPEGEGVGNKTESETASESPQCRWFRAGDAFGEESLEGNGKRDYLQKSYVAMERTDCCVVMKEFYDSVIRPSTRQIFCNVESIKNVLKWKKRGNRGPGDISHLMELCERVPFFAMLPVQVCHALCNCFTLETTDAGEAIFEQGDGGTYFGIMLTGIASIHIKDPPNANYFEGLKLPEKRHTTVKKMVEERYGFCVENLFPGCEFGSYSILSEHPLRKATVLAMEKTLWIKVSKADYVNSVKELQNVIEIPPSCDVTLEQASVKRTDPQCVELAEFLVSNVSFLKQIPYELIFQLSQTAILQNVSASTPIIFENAPGENAQALYIIIKGSISLHIKDPAKTHPPNDLRASTELELPLSFIAEDDDNQNEEASCETTASPDDLASRLAADMNSESEAGTDMSFRQKLAAAGVEDPAVLDNTIGQRGAQLRSIPAPVGLGSVCQLGAQLPAVHIGKWYPECCPCLLLSTLMLTLTFILILIPA
jgi:CRP-like cAMP-binding protein